MLLKRGAYLALALLLVLSLLPSAMAEEVANLLQNPSFEEVGTDGLPLYWKTDAYRNTVGITYYTLSDDAHDGEHSVRIENEDYNDARFYQTVSVEPNTLYRLSGYVKATGTLDEGRGANLSIKDISVFSESVYESADEWVYLELYGKTTEDQREVTIFARLGGYSGESIGSAWLDDLCLEKVETVPEGVKLEWWAPIQASTSSGSTDADTVASAAWPWLLLLAVLYGAAVVACLQKMQGQTTPTLNKKNGKNAKASQSSGLLVVGVALAALLRLIVAFNVTGYQVDINCFISWGNTLVNEGPANFYQATSFCDYPPAYVYIMGFNTLLARLLSFMPVSAVHKLIPMACDLAAAVLVYRLAQKKMSRKWANFLFLLMALNPAILLNSAGWGQVDSVLSLLLVLVAYWAITGQWLLALPTYMLAVLVKPQALMMGFLGLAAIVMTLLRDKRCWKEMLKGVGAALVLALVIVLPFSVKQGGLTWLFELYGKTLSSYAYATVNTANLYYLVNCNWRSIVYAAPTLVTLLLMLLSAAWVVYLTYKKNQIRNQLVKEWPTLLATLCLIVAGFSLAGVFSTQSSWTRRMVFHLGFTVTISRVTLLVLGLLALVGAAVALVLVVRRKHLNWDVLEVAISATFVLIFGGLALFNASFTMVGTVAMAYAFLLVMPMFIRSGEIENLPLCGAVIFVLLFVFGIKMHERYLFPALFLLGLAYLYRPDKRILIVLVGMSAVLFLNEGIVLDNSIRLGSSQGHLNNDTRFLAQLMSLLNVALALLSVWTCREVCMGAEIRENVVPQVLRQKLQTAKPDNRPVQRKPLSFDSKLYWCRLDWVLMMSVTLIYAVVALTNLGSMKAPQNPWTSSTKDEQIVIDLGDHYDDVSMLYFCQVSYSDFSIAVSEDGENWSDEYWAQMAEGQCFQWKYLVGSYESNGTRQYFSSGNWESVQRLSGRYVRVTAQQVGLKVNELIFRDSNGNTIPAKVVQQLNARETSPLYSDPANLFDEQDTLEGEPSWWTGTYFDEIYHARTAYEHLNGTIPYETSHPPLGKVIMSWGIAIFGMTPFGWRFMGAMMGVLMLPVMYLLGKQLTKKSSFAFAAMALLALDCQHFTQTRIATIDSYPVLFILLSWLFMLRFMQKDVIRLPLKKLLPDLALSGFFMGCGIACKWIGIYSGAGLAVVFFWILFRHLRVGCMATQKLKTEKNISNELKEDLNLLAGTTVKRLLTICLWCLLFFVLIPVVVYCLSYIPYFAYAKFDNLKDYLNAVWNAQLSMFSYHSEPGRGMDHPFYSPWYDWPLNKRPMYYCSPAYLTQSGWSYALWCFGNPAVWTAGLIAVAYVAFTWARRHTYRLKKDGPMLHLYALDSDITWGFLLISALAQYLPWVLVPRGTYIYHYFATTPFLMLSLTVMLQKICDRWQKVGKIILWSFLALCLVFFVAYFPYASGVLTPTWWLDFMKQFLWIYH